MSFPCLIGVHACCYLVVVSRGFVERCKFRVKLALKREQEGKVASFLYSIWTNSENLFQAQLALCQADLETPIPSAPPLELLRLQPAPPPPSAPPLSVLTQQTVPPFLPPSLLLPPPPPPPDFSQPPPEPRFSDLVRDRAMLGYKSPTIFLCRIHKTKVFEFYLAS